MIGQHIYSRCLEGYFSRSAVNADSTTVTISSRMFAREEQARKVADQCAGISTLEDVRPVPVQTQGPYRGVLKIRRLNHQITVVCRSYRLHADQPQTGGFSGSGEFRDFTFASSYILTGEDKERLLAHPEYFLNIQDFESYSSVMKRIEESRMLGRNGRIEANEEYSLFRSSCREATPRVFVQAGFTRELFVNYISSLIQRISYSHYSGHERDKVLVILPSRFNPAWEKSGGNGYAEQVLAATMKLLPRCVCGQLNANTGGMNEPDASVLRGYQLVFMEIGPTGDWRRSEYSVIDLNRQESMVTEGLNTDYAEFLWEHRMDEDARNYFEEQYEALFGPENTAEGDNSPEKFALVLVLLSEEKADFADGRKRERLLADLLNYCGSAWTKRGTALAVRALQAETRDPGCGKILEKEILSLVEAGNCPESIREAAAAVLMQMILHGDVQERSIQWICRGIREKDSAITDIVRDANHRIDADSETPWHERKALLDFYCNICRDPEIHGDHPVKREILSILSAWCIKLLNRNDWENSARVTEILAEQLGHPSLSVKGRREIYQDLLYILFYGEGEGREKISEILKGEERAFPSSPGNLEIFWECFLSQARSGESALNLNKDVLWHLTYLAISREEEFLKNQWEPLYREIVQRSDVKCVPEMTGRVRENFIGWAGSVRDRKKLALVYHAIAMTEADNMLYGGSGSDPDMESFREALQILTEAGQLRDVGRLLYTRYQAESDPESRESFFIQDLNVTEKWLLLLLSLFEGGETKDRFLQKEINNLYGERKVLLQVTEDFGWDSEKEVRICANLYCHLLKHCIAVECPKENELVVWCRLYGGELGDIEKASGQTELSSFVRQHVRKEMEKKEILCIQDLEKRDLLLMREAGLLPLGEKWECLDVLCQIYTIDPNESSRGFMGLRERILSEQSVFLKSVYQSALEEQREWLREENGGMEILCSMAFLEEQMVQERERREEYSIRNVTLRIFGSCGERETLRTALGLLGIVRNCGYPPEKEIYDGRWISDSLFRGILYTADENPELFADKEVVRGYEQLEREDKAYFVQNGMREYLEDLPGEWLEKYGFREETNRMEILVPAVLGGIFLIIGIALDVSLFLFYGEIGAVPAIVTGMSLCVVGVFGNVAVLIWMLLSGKRAD